MTPSRRLFLGALGVASVSTATAAAVTDTPDDGPVWKHTYGGPNDDQLQAVTSRPDGDVVLVGRTGNSNRDRVWLAAVTPDGTLSWETTADAPGFPRAEAAVAADGGVTFAGTYGAAGKKAWLAQVGPDGDERWRREYDVEATPRTLVHADDGYLLGGFVGDPARTDQVVRAWTMRTGSDGSREFQRTYDPGTVSALVETSDGFTAATSRLYDDREPDATVLLLDRSGRVRTGRTFGGVASDRFEAVLPSEWGSWLAGSTESPADGPAGLLVRTDGDGRAVWRRTHDVEGYRDGVRTDDGAALVGEPRDWSGRGRNPRKPLVFVDSWGRVRRTETAHVNSGWPVGVARFGDGGYALAGVNARGVWVAKFG